MSMGLDVNAGLALQSAADYLETASRDLDRLASELETVVFLMREYSLPNHEWSFYPESAAGNYRFAAIYLNSAAFYFRLASWNLRGSQAVNNLTSANSELESYERSMSAADSAMTSWSIWTT